jgi:TRAP-type transport system periplasmic protein
MGAIWYMNNEKFQAMPDDLKRVVVDGFIHLQQATFASPKRKSIQAYQDFAAAGGQVYVPSPEEKAAFRDAAAPVFDWFKSNVDDGQEVFDALMAEVARAEEAVEAARAADMQ